MEKPKWPFELKPLSWGAESNLYLTDYLGIKAVLKHRFPKKYMDPRLTRRLIKTRTIREASLLIEARMAGVHVPLPLYIDSENGILVVKYVEGRLLRDVIDEEPDSVGALACTMGEMVKRLHNTDIIHGDLTTSNFIRSKHQGYIYLLDFGLAFKSRRPEDKATDIRVLERAVVSTHPMLREVIMEKFIECYTQGLRDLDSIMARYRKLSLMGRYVAERRKSLGAQQG